jgi:hypothetical protein
VGASSESARRDLQLGLQCALGRVQRGAAFVDGVGDRGSERDAAQTVPFGGGDITAPGAATGVASRRADSASTGPSMVLGSIVHPVRNSSSQVGSAVCSRWTRDRLLIERSRYSR